MTNPMQPTTAKRVETVIGSIFAAAFLWLIWGWWSFTGLYRLVALMALMIFDSYGVITTFILRYVGLAFVMLLTFRLLRPLGLIVPNKPLSPVTEKVKAEIKEKVGIGLSRFMIGVAAVSLIVFLASVVGLVNDSHRNSAVVTLDLASPAPLAVGTALVRLVGFSKPELIVGVSTKQTPGVDTSSESFMAVVGPHWHRGETVPVIVQGSPALGIEERKVDPEEQGREIKLNLPVSVVRTTTSGFAEYLLERSGQRATRTP